MLSERCKTRNETIIPKLLREHFGKQQPLVDLRTAENWHAKENLKKLTNTGLGSGDDIECALSHSNTIGGDAELRKLLAHLLNLAFEPCLEIKPVHITLTAGASLALTTLAEQICNPGDGIMTAAPYWPGLDLAITVHKDVKIVPVRVPLDAIFKPESFDWYEKAMKESSCPVKAILLCNPHNPLGHCFPKDTLQAVFDLCRRQNIHLISDEVYGLSIHGREAEFSSALSLHDSGGLVNVVYSLSKDFGCIGIRLGAIINQHDKCISLGSALSTQGQISSLSTLFATRCLLNQHNIEYIRFENPKHLRASYLALRDFLQQRSIPHFPATAGFFVFAQLFSDASAASENAIKERLQRYGLALSSGTSYHFAEYGWFRICFAVPPSLLSEALQRLHRCLDDT